MEERNLGDIQKLLEATQGDRPVRPEPIVIEKLYRSSLTSYLIHVVLPQYPELGHRLEWEISWPMMHELNLKHEDSSPFVIRLLSIGLGTRDYYDRYERVLSVFEFRSFLAMQIYAHPPKPAKLIQFQYQEKMLFRVSCRTPKLERAFNEVFRDDDRLLLTEQQRQSVRAGR